MEVFAPINLFLALTSHFKTGRLILLTDVITDQEVEFASKLEQRIDVYFQMMDLSTVDEIGLDDDSLLVITKAVPAEIGKQDFANNKYWLFLQEATELLSFCRFDSNCFFAKGADQGGKVFEIEEQYVAKGKAFHNHIGTWTPTGGLAMSMEGVWERRRDLGGLSLLAHFLAVSPFVTVRQDGSLAGLEPEVLHALQQALNFTTEYVPTETKQFGAPLGNGSWTGIIGMLDRKEIDIAVAPLAITDERADVVDFMTSFFEGKATLSIVNPAHKRTPINFAAFLIVFSPYTWLTILVAFMIIWTLQLGHTLTEKNIPRSIKIFSLGLSSMFWSFKAMLQLQNFNPHSLSNKIFVITVAVFFFIILSYYQAMLTSFMTVNAPAAKITSHLDAAEKGYQMIVLEGTSQARDLETALPGTGRYEVYSRQVKGNPEAYFTSISDMKDAMLANPMLATSGSVFFFWQDDRFLSLTSMDDVIMNYGSIALQLDSEFKGLLNHHIMKMMQSGQLAFFHQKWMRQRRPFGPEAHSFDSLGGFSELGYDNLFFPAFILGTGVVVSFAFSLLEKCNNVAIKLLKSLR